MPPIPCANCGHNFMRQTTNVEAPKLCNSCLYRDNIKKEKKMETLTSILIQLPSTYQARIEDFCLKNNISFSQYFIDLIDKDHQKKIDSAEYICFDEGDLHDIKESREELSEKRQKGRKK